MCYKKHKPQDAVVLLTASYNKCNIQLCAFYLYNITGNLQFTALLDLLQIIGKNSDVNYLNSIVKMLIEVNLHTALPLPFFLKYH